MSAFATDISLVIPGLFISGRSAAQNKTLTDAHKIQHILSLSTVRFRNV